LKLVTIKDVRSELGRLYRSAKAGRTQVADASKLSNILAILARCIESSELEQRVKALEDGYGD
jgi:hypothetical protein